MLTVICFFPLVVVSLVLLMFGLLGFGVFDTSIPMLVSRSFSMIEARAGRSAVSVPLSKRDASPQRGGKRQSQRDFFLHRPSLNRIVVAFC